MVKVKNGITYIFAKCKSASAKATKFYINIQLRENDEIELTNCDCTVGSGSKAHCKHVVGFL